MSRVIRYKSIFRNLVRMRSNAILEKIEKQSFYLARHQSDNDDDDEEEIKFRKINQFYPIKFKRTVAISPKRRRIRVRWRALFLPELHRRSAGRRTMHHK